MKINRRFSANCLLLAFFVTLQTLSSVQAQKRDSEVYKFPENNYTETRSVIRIPDIDGYKTLKCDFHSHTFFSDGHVSPVARVNEAWNDGLDAIAITDHIEYRPHKEYVIADFNKSNELAVAHGNNIGFIVIKGAEITRKKPIGHLNALFIQDANKLEVKDPVDAIKEAVSQGAFILWNHPGWPDDSTTMYDIHKKLIKEKLIHGVELCNGFNWYPRVMTWIKETGITVTANTDIHHLTGTAYGDGAKRTMTLVFAKERTEEAIKEALFAGRTLALFQGYVAGKEQYIKSLIKASLDVRVINAEKGLIEVTNLSDFQFVLKHGKYNLNVVLPGKAVRMTVKQGVEVEFSNCVISENDRLSMKLW